MRGPRTRERILIAAALFAVAAVVVGGLGACTTVYGSDFVQAPIAADSGELPDGADAASDGTDFPLELDGAADDRVSADAGGSAIDASGCAASDCDCDRDGFLDLVKPGCADAGGLADCDDLDSRVRPGQNYLDLSNPPRSGDWNCSGVVERLERSNVDPCNQHGNRCSYEGFTGTPSCGDTGNYLVCRSPNNNGCRTASTGTRRQACK